MRTVAAQDPAAAQDAEAAREKLLKAADQLDNIQANAETTRTSVDGMKTDVAALQQSVGKLESDNMALRQQLADLQNAFDAYKASQAKSKQALIDNVAGLVAGATARAGHHKKDAVDSGSEGPAPERTPAAVPTAPTAANLAPPADGTPSRDSGPVKLPPEKPQKGYVHVVADGETVAMIVEAYRDSGVNVSASQIRKANGLTSDSVLKAGQKLFIPKPGT